MGAAVKQVKGGKQNRFGRAPKRRVTSPLDKAKAHEVVWPNVSAIFAATRGVSATSYVYFIGEHDDGPVKIGVAKDPIARLRGMQTGNPRRLRVERVLVGDMHIEKLLHEFWEPLAIVTPANSQRPGAPPGTEWFAAEIRKRLFPIVDTAAERQVDLLLGAAGAIDFLDLEQIVRDAHKEYDFVVEARDQVRLLAAGAGYIVDRVSRI